MLALTKNAIVALRLTVALALVCAPRSLSAQDQAQTVALAGGPTVARSPFADTVGSGVHVTGGVGFNFGERFALRMEGMYQQVRSLTANARDHQMVGFMTAAEIDILAGSGPYVLGGYGFYQTLKSGTVPASAWDGGYNVGGGYRLRLARVSLFGEVRLHQIRGEGRPAMVPFSFGLRL